LLISYAEDFVSFLIESIDFSRVRSIILFGSVSREEANEESDIDLFIDLVKEDKKIVNQIQNVKEKFYSSVKFKEYWQLRGINNEFVLKVGDITKWKELGNSLVSNGLVLYGKYFDVPEGKNLTLFVWENISPESKRIMCSKKLFGYVQNEKRYGGLIEKYSGVRLGKGIIIIPTESSNLFVKFFRENKINVKIRKVLDYS